LNLNLNLNLLPAPASLRECARATLSRSRSPGIPWSGVMAATRGFPSFHHWCSLSCMIDPIPGWAWELGGEGITLVPPEGAACGAIRYVERVRPLQRIIDIARPADLPSAVGFKAVGPPERVITREGEYGAILTVEGTLPAGPVRRTVGCVYGDDFYSKIVGVALRPDQFDRFAATVRALVETDAHVLGVRRRRCVYRPPKGWHGLNRGSFFHAQWYPPEFPKDASEMVIYPAWPTLPEGAADAVNRMVGLQMRPGSGLTLEEVQGPEEVKAESGLTGVHWQLVVRRGPEIRFTRDLFVLEDGRFIYPLHVDSFEAQRQRNRALLEEVMRSVQPIPTPGSAPTDAQHALAMSYWVE